MEQSNKELNKVSDGIADSLQNQEIRDLPMDDKGTTSAEIHGEPQHIEEGSELLKETDVSQQNNEIDQEQTPETQEIVASANQVEGLQSKPEENILEEMDLEKNNLQTNDQEGLSNKLSDENKNEESNDVTPETKDQAPKIIEDENSHLLMANMPTALNFENTGQVNADENSQKQVNTEKIGETIPDSNYEALSNEKMVETKQGESINETVAKDQEQNCQGANDDENKKSALIPDTNDKTWDKGIKKDGDNGLGGDGSYQEGCCLPKGDKQNNSVNEKGDSNPSSQNQTRSSNNKGEKQGDDGNGEENQKRRIPKSHYNYDTAENNKDDKTKKQEQSKEVMEGDNDEPKVISIKEKIQLEKEIEGEENKPEGGDNIPEKMHEEGSNQPIRVGNNINGEVEEQKLENVDPIENKNPEEEPIKIPEKYNSTLRNCNFYRGDGRSKPDNLKIEYILKNWKGDYDVLEDNHSYIQWLFPNHFQSRFNYNAYCLTKEEATYFIHDLKIAERFVESFRLILDFYGVKLSEDKSQKPIFERSKDFENRFQKTLRTSFHNHLRITRILSCLSVTGFRIYAKGFLEFLKYEIEEGALMKLKKYKVLDEWMRFAEPINEDDWEKLEDMTLSKRALIERVSVYFKENNEQKENILVEEGEK